MWKIERKTKQKKSHSQMHRDDNEEGNKTKKGFERVENHTQKTK